MDDRERALALERVLAAEAAALRSAPRVPAAALREMRLAELRGSLAAAGIAFTLSEVTGLAESGRVPGGRTLATCNAVADYAAAAAHIAAIGRARPHRDLLRLEEIVALHALATRRSDTGRPGKWRMATAPPLAGGVVPPPAWLVPQRMSAFVERFARGPGDGRPLLPWLADAHERFSRIQPFTDANGRTARLVLNLILQRLAFPPLVLRPGDAAQLAAALRRAGAAELWPSALFFGRNLLRSVRALEFARAPSDDSLLPLVDIATARELPALYKASQRGRLRTVRRGTAIFTTKAWLNEYRSSRAAAGRPFMLAVSGDGRE